MKVTKKMSIKGDWAKAKEDINEGDIITISNEGEVITGEYGDRNVFKVETKNGERLLSFNQTSMNNLIDEYGDETNQWVEKKVKVWIIKSMVAGKMRNVIYLTPPNWVETDDGFKSPDNKGTEEIPVIEDEY